MEGGSAVISHEMTLVLLFASLAIFGAVALKSRSVRSFQFQISIFIIIWISGEIVDVLQDAGVFNFYSEELGMQVHLLSMVFFSTMIWLRFYYSRQKRKKIVDKPPANYLE